MSWNTAVSALSSGDGEGVALPGPSKVIRHKARGLESSIREVLAKRNARSADDARQIGDTTARERAEFLLRVGYRLHELGFGLRRIQNLKQRHIAALVWDWEDQGFAAATMQKYMSFLRTLCGWLGKAGMVGNLSDYLKDPDRGKRVRVATRDKSWGTPTEVFEKLAEVMADDVRVALCLMMQAAFALRPKESFLFKPHNSVDYFTAKLEIKRGTKGGRPRTIDLTDRFFNEPWKLKLLEVAKPFASLAQGTLIPVEKRYPGWRSRFYRVCQRHGISRVKDFVSHGLRHQAANDLYEMLTGRASPVRGGEPPAPEEKSRDREARLKIAEILGHRRIQITGAYYGSHQPKNIDSTDTALDGKYHSLLDKLAAGPTDTKKATRAATTGGPRNRKRAKS